MNEDALSRRDWLRLLARGAAGALLAGVAVVLRGRGRTAVLTPDCSRGHACGGCPSRQRCPLPPAAARRAGQPPGQEDARS